MNNIGDPFDQPIFKFHAKKYERELLSYFSKLYGLKKNDYWGYTTTGGTEGNLYGLYAAREKYPNGVLYFSKDTHYSIAKTANLLKLNYVTVNSLKNGEIDYAQLKDFLLANSHRPALFNLNIGTTTKGAIDSIDIITNILKKTKIKNFFIHCDAALNGMILPFLDQSILNFNKPIDSIAVSIHKYIGSPFPSGIILTKKQIMKTVRNKIEDTGSADTTIASSRNGHISLITWYLVQKKKNKFKNEVRECIDNAKYLEKELMKLKFTPARNKYSNIVYFKRPNNKIIKKWQLAVFDKYAHVVVMPHVNKEILNKFIDDLKI